MTAERWLISRICEAFGCTPRVARRELARDPDEVLEILSFRAYAATKAAIDRAEKQEDAPTGPLADLVGDVIVALELERRAALAAGDDDE